MMVQLAAQRTLSARGMAQRARSTKPRSGGYRSLVPHTNCCLQEGASSLSVLDIVDSVCGGRGESYPERMKM
eukprot:1982325-Rhodomonas_salina.1